MTRLEEWTNGWMMTVADFLWPPVCPSCSKGVGTHGRLCAACWDAMTFISAPQCDVCGVPFPYALEPEAQCGECLRNRPPYRRARAALAYDAASKDMILAFKHADRTDLAEPITALMARVAGPFLKDVDLVIPVPLHYRRLVSRRYNQSAMLAQRLARMYGVWYAPLILLRQKSTETQGGKSRAARRRNVQGAFRVAEEYRSNLRDRRVLLVDDVMTTGATVEGCTRALLRSGAASVDVITFSRVLRQGL